MITCEHIQATSCTGVYVGHLPAGKEVSPIRSQRTQKFNPK